MVFDYFHLVYFVRTFKPLVVKSKCLTTKVTKESTKETQSITFAKRNCFVIFNL